jgi:hypothetical protein
MNDSLHHVDVNPTGLRARDRGRSSTILLRVDATMLE